MYKKNKGVALPGAIALATFMLLVSMGLSSIIIELVTLNKLNSVKNENNLLFAANFNYFLSQDPGLNGDDRDNKIANALTTLRNNNKYRYYSYIDDVDNEAYRSLVVYKLKEDKVIYYAIYDSSTKEVISYQDDSDNLYIPIMQKDGDTQAYYYLGGIIKLPGSPEVED